MRLSEVREVLVVGEDLDRERGAMEVVAPSFQGANDSKKLTVVDVVIPFRGGERLGKVGTGMPITI